MDIALLSPSLNLVYFLLKEGSNILMVSGGDEDDNEIVQFIKDKNLEKNRSLFEAQTFGAIDIKYPVILYAECGRIMKIHKELSKYYATKTDKIFIGFYGDFLNLENKREFGKKIALNYGINSAKYYKFTSIGKAINFVQAKKKPFVIKINSEANNAPSYTTFVPETYKGTIAFLLFLYNKLPNMEILLEEFIDGFDIDITLHVDNEKILMATLEFEHKKEREKNRGFNIGEAGSVMLFLSEKSKLFKYCENIFPYFKGRVRGQVALGFRVEYETGNLYFMEFCGRYFGFPYEPLYNWVIHTIGGGISTYLSAIAWNGNLDYLKSKIKDYVFTVINVYTPVGTTLTNYKEEGRVDNLYVSPIYYVSKYGERKKFDDVSFLDDGYIFHSWDTKNQSFVSDGSFIATVGGVGKTLSQALQDMYRKVERIDYPKYYRKDIGRNLILKDADVLFNAGWITMEEYRKLKGLVLE